MASIGTEKLVDLAAFVDEVGVDGVDEKDDLDRCVGSAKGFERGNELGVLVVEEHEVFLVKAGDWRSYFWSYDCVEVDAVFGEWRSVLLAEGCEGDLLSEGRGRDYSSRSNITGSTDSARWAGTDAANSPTHDIAKTTPTSTIGSRGVAWYTIEASTRLARIPRSSPAVEPKASNWKARPSATLNISFRCAPRATRMPNSRRRLVTEYAAMPNMLVIASIAPITPTTPSARLAI